jgi:tetratricopeptide (TPR) repeat protein
MTVKDIFALRKQGKIEEAYEAIRPIYKEHKGKFTTLCMFWVASDVFKLRLEQKRIEEAEKIYRAMLRLLPFIEDDPEHKAKGFMHYAEGRLIKAAIEREKSQARLNSSEREQARAELKASEKFRKRYFAIRDKKKRVDNPSDNPSKGLNPCNPNNPCSVELNAGQSQVLDCIKSHPGLRVPGLEAETGIPAKSVERHIKVLIERRLIEHRGSKKTGGYHAL